MQTSNWSDRESTSSCVSSEPRNQMKKRRWVLWRPKACNCKIVWFFTIARIWRARLFSSLIRLSVIEKVHSQSATDYPPCTSTRTRASRSSGKIEVWSPKATTSLLTAFAGRHVGLPWDRRRARVSLLHN